MLPRGGAVKIQLQHISDMAKHRPAGYYEDVLSSGVVVGDTLVLDDAVYNALCRKYRPTMPGISEMVGNFAKAIGEWAGKGFPVVSNEQFTSRYDVCRACENWTGYRCKICGCTKMKLWLETEKCPERRWE